ncbi:MAG: hypothetical protein WC260_02215 [Candidatus Pacearchaeota archaeon]
MNKYNLILEKQLKKISLSKQELNSLKSISDKLILELKKNNLNAFIGGSFAKETIIKKKGKQDIDIFVVFKNEKKINQLGLILEKINFPGELNKIHGSRDYYQINYDNIVLEIIPIVEKESGKVNNVTDISLSHVNYISKKLKENKHLIDEIKLAKSFMQACDCYGAESYISGFSGYSIEVLVIYFKGFINFLKGTKKEKIIDIENYFKNKKMILYELNESKIKSPLIVIDPTFKYRNICAGLSFKTYEKFISTANNFLKKPSINYFEKKDIDLSQLKIFAINKKARLIRFNFSTEKQRGDIGATKMKKFFDFIIEELKRNEQEILEDLFEYNKQENSSKGYIIVREKNVLEIKGPPINLSEKIKAFKKLHKNTFEKKGYIYYKKNIKLGEIINFCKSFEKDMDVFIEEVIYY